jgi:hypothetical protein
MIFGNNEKADLPVDDDYISGGDKCKYLGFLFTENSNSSEEISKSKQR